MDKSAYQSVSKIPYMWIPYCLVKAKQYETLPPLYFSDLFPRFCSPPQIRIASRLNAKTVLDLDNAKLAADDFKMK